MVVTYRMRNVTRYSHALLAVTLCLFDDGHEKDLRLGPSNATFGTLTFSVEKPFSARSIERLRNAGYPTEQI